MNAMKFCFLNITYLTGLAGNQSTCGVFSWHFTSSQLYTTI